MVKKSRGPPPEGVWAYAYYIALPANEDHHKRVQGFLDQEHADADGDDRIWAGRVVMEPQVMRILVVSDSPAQDRSFNRRVEAALDVLKPDFEMTFPVAVVDDVPPLSPVNGHP